MPKESAGGVGGDGGLGGISGLGLGGIGLGGIGGLGLGGSGLGGIGGLGLGGSGGDGLGGRRLAALLPARGTHVQAWALSGSTCRCTLSPSWWRRPVGRRELEAPGPAQLPGTVCDYCGKSAAQASVNNLKACSQCQAVRYCGAACSVAAWPGHKAACKARAAEKAEMTKPKFRDASSDMLPPS